MCLVFLVFSVMGMSQIRPESNTISGKISRGGLLPSGDSESSINLLNEKRVKPLDIKEDDEGIDFLGKEKYATNKAFDYSTVEDNPKISLETFRRNQHLGESTTSKDFVQVVCRDYGYVDGDVIDVYLNDELVVSSVVLQGSYKALHIKLQPGFNKIEFKAKNMGSSPPNTAELRIYDGDGLLISNNQWALATGYKASFIIVKN